MPSRCEDCLQDFAPGVRRFVVLEPPTEAEEQEWRQRVGYVPSPDAELSADERDLIRSLLWREKGVCAECVGWYREYAEVTDA